jgi:hypothetical protein
MATSIPLILWPPETPTSERASLSSLTEFCAAPLGAAADRTVEATHLEKRSILWQRTSAWLVHTLGWRTPSQVSSAWSVRLEKPKGLESGVPRLRLGVSHLRSTSNPYPNPQLVPKINILWSRRQCGVREVGKLDLQLREKNWL